MLQPLPCRVVLGVFAQIAHGGRLAYFFRELALLLEESFVFGLQLGEAGFSEECLAHRGCGFGVRGSCPQPSAQNPEQICSYFVQCFLSFFGCAAGGTCAAPGSVVGTSHVEAGWPEPLGWVSVIGDAAFIAKQFS